MIAPILNGAAQAGSMNETKASNSANVRAMTIGAAHV